VEFKDGNLKYTERYSSKQKALKAAAEVIDSHPEWRSSIATYGVANPAGVKKSKRNLDEISKAVKLTEQFKGSPAKEVLEINEPARVRDDYAHLGWLLQLVFHPPYDREELDLKEVSEAYEEMMNDGADPNKSWQELSEAWGVPLLVFDFTGDEIRLAASADGKQLYLIGGRQDLFRNQLKAFKSDPEHDRVDLGEIISITYEAKKAQAGDAQPHPYYHIFGEEGGEAPRAFYDTLNNRIAIVGGSYHLKDADLGIVN
jgi:hypothetical protein